MLTDKLFIVSLAVLALLALGVLTMVLVLAARRPAVRPQGDAKIARIRFDSLRSSFRQAVELIEGNIVSRAERYAIPWIMVLDEGDGRSPLPIAQSGVSSALSTEAASAAATQGISWHFFDRGVVIDIKGVYLGSPDDDVGAEKPWDEFLGLCRAYRPSRPFDSVVLTVPADLLFDGSADGRLELGKRAKLAHRRLWLAQNRFAMRFAVYVVVTGAERLPGFAAFARALPEPMRASMLGWSSPYDLSASYQAGWVDEAMGSVVRTVSDTSAELFAKGAAPEDAGALLLLPSRIQGLQAQLQLYVDEVMRPSAYHEPFFFRGIYLTGDVGDLPVQPVDSNGLDFAPGADLQLQAHDSQHDLIAQLSRQPVFLRDLFEKKIFAEYGLTRASSNGHLARPMLHRAARWGAIAVLGGWSIGLVFATVNMQRRHTELVATLGQLNDDAATRTRAARRGETLPSAWYRQRALALLAISEQLRGETRGSVFMPGSWRIFDNLDARVSDRIELAFGDIAVTTLRRELLARAAQLTGAEQDEAVGDFITGGDCSLPQGFAGLADVARRDSLAPESLPEFAALQRYAVQVDQLDAALQAMERLRGNGGTEDLRTVVRYALGAELPQDVAGSLRFFRQAAVDGTAPSGIAYGSLRDAVRCSFAKGAAQLDSRLFTGNPLLQDEARLAGQLSSVVDGAGNNTALDQARVAWRDIVATIKEQESLIASGTGGWMRQPTLNLGPAWDRLVSRVAQTRLLGDVSAARMRDAAQADFQRFRADFTLAYGGAQPGIVWLEKEGRFTLSPERAALRDAFTGLMAQPFVTAPTARELPTLPAQALAVWNPARLDQALAVADLRKRFVAEGLAAFPAPLRAGMQSAVDAHFARMVMAQVGDALGTDSSGAGPGMDAETAFDAARQRLAKVAALLAELGAPQRADELRALVSRDALARLRNVDDNLARSELYAMRGRDFSAWQGDKGPVLAAFGANDASGLAAYLGQQVARIETLSRQADVYLASLDAAGSSSALAQRWQAIARDLERYRMKNPNSSLLQLDQYLLGVGVDIDRASCSEKLGSRTITSRGDYFGERQAQIANALISRCADLQYGEQQEQWQRFAAGFNQSLSGRHPFSATLARDTPVADATDVGAVLRSFDPVQKSFADTTGARTPPAVVRGYRPGAAARRFVQQFDRVKGFLSPLFPTEEGAVAGYDVAVDFRANTTGEIEGNQIIEWSIDIGGQALTQRDTPRTLRWEYGMPVAITLRLAKDSPLAAGTDPQQPALATDGQTVVYRFNDPWALIALIQRQREAEPAARPEGRSSLVRLEFPVRAQSAADVAQQPRGGKARVYLRLTMMAAGKKVPVNWPGGFPVRAPDWTAP